MEAVLLIAHEKLTHGSDENRDFSKKTTSKRLNRYN
jgi:hypothetical protein